MMSVDDPTIMAITGHKSLSMLDRYSHPRRAACKAALAKLAASLPLEADDTKMTQSGDQAVGTETLANACSELRKCARQGSNLRPPD